MKTSQLNPFYQKLLPLKDAKTDDIKAVLFKTRKMYLETPAFWQQIKFSLQILEMEQELKTRE